QGRDQIYYLQTFDSAYRVVIEECFPHGVWLTEPDGRLLYVTPSFLELLGTDLAELREKGPFHFLPFQTRAAAEREWARCRQTHAPLNLEYTVRLRDGSERTIWTRGL